MYFHEVFVVLQNHEWQLTHIRQLNRILSTDLLPKQSDQVPDGLKFHIISLYLEELGKVGAKEVSNKFLFFAKFKSGATLNLKSFMIYLNGNSIRILRLLTFDSTL